GITTEYYTAEITKLSGDTTDCKVNSLSIQNTQLNPAFDVDDHNGNGESFSFSSEISSGKLSAGDMITNLMLTTNSGAASITVTDYKGSTTHSGGQVAHQLNQADFPSREAPYIITTLVKSGDNSNSTTYIINLTVREGNNDATLSNGDGLIITWGTYSSRTVVYPGTFASHNTRNYQFSSNLYEYIAIVAGTETVTVKAKTSDANAASISINGTSGSPDSKGEFSADINLTKGYITTVTIDVKAEDNSTTQSYTVKIRLLNAYEYYWGIYVPVNNKSYTRQFDWKETHGLIFDDTMNDYTGTGTLRWKTEMTPSTHMWWTNYNDGNAGATSYDVRTDYNYNHPTDLNLDGFILQGETFGELESITNKDGYVYGGFLIETPWGDPIIEILVNYWIDDQEKIDYDNCDGNSWVEVVYMGEFFKIKYEVDGIPYPFSDTSFDWGVPWIPNNILPGYPTTVPADWSWRRDL
ncbi:MAG: cadherin-like beta sandwich domain-containing protein, partial [Bacteroidales bacterium]|nr:cadherin-like beta sandwich domain-containing protein [Bacteroidales bacterium]